MRAVVTGGTKGIGRGVTERLAEPGARLLVNFRNDAAVAAEVVAACEARGAWAKAVQADACTLEGARTLAAAAEEHLGEVDGLVHCAVVTAMASALTIDPELFRASIDRNGSSLLWLVQSFRPLLVRGSGVVFISSSGSTVAVPNYVAVGAGKALADALVRYLAAELAEAGINVNSVCSGPVDTEALRSVAPQADKLLERARRKSPSKRDLQPADVAEVVTFLLGPGSKMIVGDRVHVDGGIHMAY
jgi:enoyl-[acyl-carrier protein] reductase III